VQTADFMFSDLSMVHSCKQCNNDWIFTWGLMALQMRINLMKLGQYTQWLLKRVSILFLQITLFLNPSSAVWVYLIAFCGLLKEVFGELVRIFKKTRMENYITVVYTFHECGFLRFQLYYWLWFLFIANKYAATKIVIL
jgi:hypothetical protein